MSQFKVIINRIKDFIFYIYVIGLIKTNNFNEKVHNWTKKNK